MRQEPKSLDPLELLQAAGLYLKQKPTLEPAVQGLVNRVFLTPEYVVRISKNAQTDHPRECLIAQHLLKLGVKTARPVAWDRHYSIWERLPGVSLQQWGQVSEDFWGQVFSDLEIIHLTHPIAENPPKYWKAEFGSSLETTRAKWSTEDYHLLEQIETLPHPLHNPVFVHGDLFPANLMVGPDGSYGGMIDWGCAGFLGLERELSRMKPRSFELALKRWGNQLDLELLYKQRIDLLLLLAQFGRVGFDVLRSTLAQYQKVAQ